MNADNASVIRPRAKTPTVWVTVTVRPRKAACLRRPPRSDEIGGDYRLAVAGTERVHRAPEEREQERERDETGAQLLLGDEAGEPAVAALVDGHARRRAPSRTRARVRHLSRCRVSTSRRAERTSSGLDSWSLGYARNSSLDGLGRRGGGQHAGTRVVLRRRPPSSRSGRGRSRRGTRGDGSRSGGAGEAYTDSNLVVRSPPDAGRKGEGMPVGPQANGMPVDPQRDPAVDPGEKLGRSRLLLEGRDLGQVEDVEQIRRGRPMRRRGCSGWS